MQIFVPKVAGAIRPLCAVHALTILTGLVESLWRNSLRENRKRGHVRSQLCDETTPRQADSCCQPDDY